MSTIKVKSTVQRTPSSKGTTGSQAVKPQRVAIHETSQFEKERKTFAGIGKTDLSALISSSNGQKPTPADTPIAESERTYRLPTGVEIQLPRMNDNERQSYRQLTARAEQAGIKNKVDSVVAAIGYQVFAKLHAEEQANKQTTSQQHTGQLQSSSAALATSTSGTAGTDLETAADNVLSLGAQGDLASNESEAFENGMLMGVAGVENGLYNFLSNVQRQEDVARDLRTDISDIESTLNDWPEGEATERFDYREVTLNDDGSVTVTEFNDVEMTQEQALAMREKLTATMDALGSVSMRNTAVLQRMVNDYQRAVSLASEVMKNQNETRKAMISNVRA